MKQQDFILELQRQAKQGSLLHQNRLLPPQIDGVTSFVGRHPWQIILSLSFLGSLLWSFLEFYFR